MNFSQQPELCFDSPLMQSVIKIMSTQHLSEQKIYTINEPRSFIKIESKSEVQVEDVSKTAPTSINQFGYNFNSNCDFASSLLSDSYCLCSKTNTNEAFTQSFKLDKDLTTMNFETYKQIKKVAKNINPDISKEEIYEKLLKPFQHEKVKIWDSVQSRFKISYVCKYDECEKEFTKTWNLLDHVRMHEGIKPFGCQICGKAFTQKGNLKKHNVIQHSAKSLKERKKFKCRVCGRRYTERYNLVSHMKKHEES